MKTVNKLTLIALAAALTAPAQASTISGGSSKKMEVTLAKKRNFRQNIVAVDKAHDSWKKAHLNTTLYACQLNSERVAVLARKVSDRMEATKKEALAAAKAAEKTVVATVGADATEVPDELTYAQVNTLKAKAELLAKARKQADLLEHLAGQVMRFYENDIPKESARDGECTAQYQAAMQKGVVASEAYHAESAALSQKLDKLATEAEIAYRTAKVRTMLAGN